MAKRAQPVLYDADTLLHPNHHPVSIWDSEEVVQIVLWYLVSGCSSKYDGDRAVLVNFVFAAYTYKSSLRSHLVMASSVESSDFGTLKRIGLEQLVQMDYHADTF
ncbi:hypothetical protein Tco_1541664 [Tanacetum coccineum]